jgi:hypothetical protein
VFVADVTRLLLASRIRAVSVASETRELEIVDTLDVRLIFVAGPAVSVTVALPVLVPTVAVTVPLPAVVDDVYVVVATPLDVTAEADVIVPVPLVIAKVTGTPFTTFALPLVFTVAEIVDVVVPFATIEVGLAVAVTVPVNAEMVILPLVAEFTLSFDALTVTVPSFKPFNRPLTVPSKAAAPAGVEDTIVQVALEVRFSVLSSSYVPVAVNCKPLPTITEETGDVIVMLSRIFACRVTFAVC